MYIKKLPADSIDLGNMNIATEQFDKIGKVVPIDSIPWKKYPYKPDVNFRIASTGNKILLKFYVYEQEVKCSHFKDNEMVCEDSCVEFFIAQEDSDFYYNFEFNCCGTALVQYGKNRENRNPLDLSDVKKIQRISSIHDYTLLENGQLNYWELFLVIPSEVFVFSNIETFSGLNFKANFYKCGDLHSIPHYLTWNLVKTKEPDFHSPKYFRKIFF